MFNENLKAQRKLKGFTQETLAIKVNVVRQTVSKWEKGLSLPDADTLQKLAEVLDITVSQLLGAETPDKPENKNEIAEQLSRINEQLAIKNTRARKVWKTIVIVLILIIIVSSLFSISYTVKHKNNKVAGITEFTCMLDGKEYWYSIQYNDNYQILSAGGDAYIDDYINTKIYSDANQLAAHIKDYFAKRGGTTVTTEETGLKLYE